MSESYNLAHRYEHRFFGGTGAIFDAGRRQRAQGLKRRNLDKNGNMNDDRRGTQHNECLFVISLVNLGDGVVG